MRKIIQGTFSNYVDYSAQWLPECPYTTIAVRPLAARGSFSRYFALPQNAGGCRSPLPYVRHSRYAVRYGHECPPLHAARSYARTVSSILPHAGHARTNRNSGCSVLRQPCRSPHCIPGCHRERPGPLPGGTASFPLPDASSYRTRTRP